MTGCPFHIPTPTVIELEELDNALDGQSALLRASPFVLAEPWSDSGDPAVFAYVTAVQLVEGEPWLVRAVLRAKSGRRPTLRRVAVEHYRDATVDVTGRLMRDLRFDEIRVRALERLQQKGRLAPVLVATEWISSERAADITAAAEEAGAGASRGYSASHYRDVAISFLEVVGLGDRGIYTTLASEWSERLGRPVRPETVRGWVKKATELDFLASGHRGVVGRDAGPRLVEPTKGGNDG